MPCSPLQVALSWRCPECGKGKLFAGVLAVAERCGACGLSLKEHEKGDGPAVFVITLVGFLVSAMAAWVELEYAPPYWLHAVLWVPLVLLFSLYFLRFFKALIVAVQYNHLGLK